MQTINYHWDYATFVRTDSASGSTVNKNSRSANEMNQPFFARFLNDFMRNITMRNMTMKNILCLCVCFVNFCDAQSCAVVRHDTLRTLFAAAHCHKLWLTTNRTELQRHHLFKIRKHFCLFYRKFFLSLVKICRLHFYRWNTNLAFTLAIWSTHTFSQSTYNEI